MLEGWCAACKYIFKNNIQEDKNPYKNAPVQVQATLEEVPMKASALFLIAVSQSHLVLSLDSFPKYSVISKAPLKEQRAKRSIFIMKKWNRDEGTKAIRSFDPDLVC